jgi:hydrogenase expression/formation protein HypE
MELNCPIPLADYPYVLLAHGGGGRLMHQLIQKMFLSAFGNPILDLQHDAALLSLPKNEIAMTTDSYVVRPLFFPGGDIGSLAVYGTVNDLAMAGARPLYLSVGLILEEGLPMETLWRVVLSMREAAERAQVKIVTGDTKVVNRGKGDGIFINTSGIGVLESSRRIAPQEIQGGDAILLNGDLGRHGIVIMAAREGLEFETTLQSDSAPLSDLILELLRAGIPVHCLRDLTRGGLASALVELSFASQKSFEIDEGAVPVCEEVRGACEILGLDPWHVANEGRSILFVPQEAADETLKVMRDHPLGRGAARIGQVTEDHPGRVVSRNKMGVFRIVEMMSGEQLPRIC